MHDWHAYEQYAADTARERLAEAERARLVRLARATDPLRDLAWPRLLVWELGSALVALGERLIAAARAYPLPERAWSQSTTSCAGG